MKRLISLLLSVVLLVGLLSAGALSASAESAFTASEDMIALLKMLEGFSRYPIWDYSQWTVGYGTACPAEDLERLQRDGITVEEAEVLLTVQLNGFEKSVNSFNDKYGLNFTQNQFDAVLLFTYNLGNSWMFREGSFRTALINGVTGVDLMFEFGQWSHAGGEVLTQLVKRRLMEYNMFTNGIYSRTVPENYCYVLYEFNGGKGETDVQCYDSNVNDVPRVTPTKEGYVFEGWYTANSGGQKVTVLDASVRNMTLYARWTAETVDSPEKPTEPSEPKEPTQPSEPEEETPAMEPMTVTVDHDFVNIRKGPGTNYGTSGQANKGDQMTITEVQTGTGYTWGKFEGGWIALMYTNYQELLAQKPEEEAPAQPGHGDSTPGETEPETAAVMGTITGSDLRIRAGAGTSYSVQGFLQMGDRVEILETKVVGSMTWGRIDEGWISMSYVKLDEIEEPEQEETPPVTEPPVTEPPVTEPEETTQMGTVTGSDLRIRSGAGTSYSVVGFLQKGDRVEILETKTVNGMTWGRIENGWTSLSYVDLDKPATEPETRTVTITADCLRVRSEAGTSYEIVGYLYWGAKVEVYETKTVNGVTWGRIENGWISMDYVK